MDEKNLKKIEAGKEERGCKMALDRNGEFWILRKGSEWEALNFNEL